MRFTELRGDDPKTLCRASDLLSAGGLLVHPTSGVYGLGGRLDPAVDEEVARLKCRPEGRGTIRLVASLEAARGEFPALRVGTRGGRLADAFWPGPLTLVLDDGTDQGVALRVEPHPFTHALLLRSGGSLGSTSVNITGGPPAAAPGSVREILAGMPESSRDVLFVNAGVLPGPPPSTLVRVSGDDAVEVLRHGAIPLEAVRLVAGDQVLVAEEADA